MISEQSISEYKALRDQMINVLFATSSGIPTDESNRTFYANPDGLTLFIRVNGRTDTVKLSLEEAYEALEPILHTIAFAFIGSEHSSIIGEYPDITAEYSRIKDLGKITNHKFLLHASQRAYARKVSEHIRQNDEQFMGILIENMKNALLRYRE